MLANPTSRKDYTAIAELIAEEYEEASPEVQGVLEMIAYKLADYFRKDNERFKKATFLKAALPEAEVIPEQSIWDDDDSHKFSTVLARLLYEAADEDASAGSSAEAGWAGLYVNLSVSPTWDSDDYAGEAPEAAIIFEDTQGFVHMEVFQSNEEAHERFAEYMDELEGEE